MKKGYLLAAAGILLPTVAYAQTSGPTVPAGGPGVAAQVATGGNTVAVAAPPQETQLEDIVVTAQKRSENVQKVPIAITALSGAQLATTGVSSITQLNVAVPAVNTRNTIGSFQPSIRGIGTSANNVENPVALYIDGVYYASQREGLREFNDIEQVSVLKGPQGTLFGRNATGGVIQITTKVPSFRTSGEVGASLDNYLRLKTDAYLSGGLTKDIAGSLAIAYQTQGDGWGKNYTTGNDSFRLGHYYALRGKLLFHLGSRTDLTLIGDYQDRSGTDGSYYDAFPGYIINIPSYIKPKNVYSTYSNKDGLLSMHSGGVSGTLKSDFGFATLTSITAYRRIEPSFSADGDGSAADLYNFSARNHQTEFSQEVQLVSPANRSLHWSVGAYYLYFRNEVNPFARLYQGIVAQRVGLQSQIINAAERTSSVSPFAQVDFQLFPQTRVTLGIRETFEDRSFKSTNALVLLNGRAVTTTPGGSFTNSSPSWRVSVDQQITGDVLGYVSYNRGFKSGGYNLANPTNPAYRPESLDAYEVGLKTQLLDHRVRLNGAFFYYAYRDLQLFQFQGAGSVVPLLVNAARAHLYGLDADIEARITPELRIAGGLLLERSAFDDYPNPSPAVANAQGNRLQLAQNVNASVTATYTKSLPWGELQLSATESHNGDYYFEGDNVLRQPAYDLFNTSISWTSPSRGVTISAFARNLLDVRVVSQGLTLGPIGLIAVYANEPRVAGAAVRFRF